MSHPTVKKRHPHILEEHSTVNMPVLWAVAYPGILFRGIQQIQLRTEDRENGDLEAVAP
jgi:hypothetical protein